MQLPYEITTKTSQETKQLAKNFARDFGSIEGSIICLEGNLGSGKTTFVKGFCEYFSIEDDKVKSPTYTYYRLYENGEKDIYHFDYYRLSRADDLIESELLEILERSNMIALIEWPEKIKHLFPRGTLVVKFSYGEGDNDRIINFSKI
ncbi:tRNA (adenosine(37)-N6)-threonylcarbamoyltransferase complex ATPase subunit type 1 TsaE [bacterium]|nr:tRNA (adenosine(37)-N6)-threonylcarbamoyltransferase complex ATPase subunit type 1 TsaE [bacterium]